MNLSPGSYQVVVTDAGNCTTSATAVTISSPSGLTFSSSKTDVTCSGNSDGTITITVSGGTAPYQYSDDNGTTFQASNVFNSLAVGTYQLVAKDASGCQFSASVSIGQPTAVTFTFTKVDAGCSGSTGSITITGSGGNNLYMYSIDNGTTYQASNTFSNLAAQTYQAIIKDGNNCTSSTSTVTINAGNLTVNSSKSDATCAGNDGSITVSSVTGGTSPYQYSIDGGTTYQASNLFTNLNVGNYSLMVKDNTGCTSSVNAMSISKPLACGGCGPLAIGVTDTRPTCAGQDDGTITVNVSGGSPNYIVKLTDASQGFSQALVGPGPNFQFINLSPSLTYQYTVSDQAGNSCSQTYSLPIQTNVQATASGFVDAKCYNQAVGQATVTVTSGGTSPYEYSLDAGATWISFTSPVVITNLMPAVAPYSILVRDDASDLCPAQVSVTINNAVSDIQITSSSTDATCANNDGSVTISSVSGGTGPYTFMFDGVSQSGLTYSGLSGGSHTFTVTDANSCVKTFPFTVNFPGLVKFSAVVNNPDCSGSGNNGSIIVTIKSSGTFDVGVTTDPVNDPTVFQNIVSAGSSTATFLGLSQGSYRIVAKPAGALCKSDTLVSISGGPIAVDFNLVSTNFLCSETKGVLKLFPITGSLAVDYNYELKTKNGIQTGTITQLQALDTVRLTGLDSGVYHIRLYQNQPICVNPITSAFKDFVIIGPPLTSFDTLSIVRNASQFNLATGSMVITLGNTLAPPYQLKLSMLSADLPSQNNSHNVFDSQFVDPDSTHSKDPIVFTASDLFAGEYRLFVNDSYGCARVYDLAIGLSTDILIPNFFTPNHDGKNDNFEIVNLPTGSSITITNRWGKEVFKSSKFEPDVQTSDYSRFIVWNGGAESDGIYYYTLTTPGKTYTGWIELQH
ncbi:MAG TPA: hypothetical protein DGG95_11535 [Cytophagales bacterium]|nr:hypothetical protein [Cytophagales bacterium]